MNGLDLASAATISNAYSEGPKGAEHHVVAFDFGMKRNILRLFVQHGCRVTVVPAATTAAETRALKPDGVFLSNGPGDPAAVGYAIDTIRTLADGEVADLWDLSRPPIARPGTGWRDGQAPVRTPWRQPSRAGSCNRTSTYHVTESWIRRAGRDEWRFPARSRLRSPTLNLNDGTVKASSTGSTRFLPSSITPRRLQAHTTPRDTFNNSYKLLTLNK